MASSSSPPKISSICVLCGARLGKNKEFQAVSNKLGAVMASKNINLVYEGALRGLMGNVSLAAVSGGARTTRIIISALRQFLGSTIGKEVEVSSIQDRVPKMLEFSDAFIALPGGLGTFNDIFLIAYWLTLSIHSKPIGLLNVGGFYDSLLTFLDNAVEQGLMANQVRRVFLVDSDAERLIEKLQAFEFEHDPSASQVDWFGNHITKGKVDLDLRLSL